MGYTRLTLTSLEACTLDSDCFMPFPTCQMTASGGWFLKGHSPHSNSYHTVLKVGRDSVFNFTHLFYSNGDSVGNIPNDNTYNTNATVSCTHINLASQTKFLRKNGKCWHVGNRPNIPFLVARPKSPGFVIDRRTFLWYINAPLNM